MKEFLKPLYLLQLIPKARAQAPDGPIHYLTAGEKEEKNEERKNKALEGGGKKTGEAETVRWYQ